MQPSTPPTREEAVLPSPDITIHHQLDVSLPDTLLLLSLLPKDATARFDGFLVSMAGVGSLMVEAASANTINSSLSSQASSEGGRGDWRVESNPALIAVVRAALNDAATSAIDQMEEQVVTATRRGESIVVSVDGRAETQAQEYCCSAYPRVGLSCFLVCNSTTSAKTSSLSDAYISKSLPG